MKTTTEADYTIPATVEARGTSAEQPSWLSHVLEVIKKLDHKARLRVVATVGAIATTPSFAGCNTPVQGIPEGQPPAAGSTENAGTPSPSENIGPTNEANNSDYEPTPLSAELSPKELGKAFYKKIDGWGNSLSHPELAKKYDELTDATEYCKQLVDETTKKYADALFIKDWNSHKDLKKYAEFTKNGTGIIFRNYIVTTHEEYTDARYKAWTEVTKVVTVSEDEDELKIQVSGIDRDNSDEFGEPTKSNGTPFTKTLTFDRLYNGEIRLSGYA